MSIESKKVDWKEAENILTRKEIEASISQLQGWCLKGITIDKILDSTLLSKAINFVNKVANIGTTENHHPDFMLWNIIKVKLTITTFCIGVLSRLDFILASKIHQI